MPLRDHFHPPLSKRRSWQELHGGWPMSIADTLNRRLPERFVAGPQVRIGALFEIDVATFEDDEGGCIAPLEPESGGGTMTAVWAPPRPSLSIPIDLGDLPEYTVRVYDEERDRRLVAAVEIVSPANKDRPEHRGAFVAKCAGMLREGICVAIVDVVTSRSASLYEEMIELLGPPEPPHDAPALSAVSLRHMKDAKPPRLDCWAEPIAVGRPLPTLPLWLAPNLAVPLELEASYEQACRSLRIP